jgi:hypothetical protein
MIAAPPLLKCLTRQQNDPCPPRPEDARSGALRSERRNPTASAGIPRFDDAASSMLAVSIITMATYRCDRVARSRCRMSDGRGRCVFSGQV